MYAPFVPGAKLVQVNKATIREVNEKSLFPSFIVCCLVLFSQDGTVPIKSFLIKIVWLLHEYQFLSSSQKCETPSFHLHERFYRLFANCRIAIIIMCFCVWNSWTLARVCLEWTIRRRYTHWVALGLQYRAWSDYCLILFTCSTVVIALR